MKVMKVHQLLNAPAGYSGLGIPNDSKIDVLDITRLLNGDIPITAWPKPEFILIDPEKPEPAIPMLLGAGVVFSNAAFLAIQADLSTEGEFLDIPTQSKRYHLFHVMKILDCLDIQASVLEFFPRSALVRKFRKLVFNYDSLSSTLVFMVPQLPFKVFCTDKFCDLMQLHKLSGYRLAVVEE